MDSLDLLLAALVLWIAYEIFNDGDFGGGKRSRIPNAWLRS